MIPVQAEAEAECGLSRAEGETPEGPSDHRSPFCGKPEEIVSIADLPFTRLRLTPDDEEEDNFAAVRTIQAWAVDIADPRQIAPMLKWLKQTDLEDPSLSHLKRIRKNEGSSSLLLAPALLFPDPPTLPDNLTLPTPYLVAVPRNPALTQASLKLKSTLWPTIYAPRKKWEPESWSQGKVYWAWEAMKVISKEANAAKSAGELPIVAYVPPPLESDVRDLTQTHSSMIAHDTRQSTSHPLRHAVMNVIRAIADRRASWDANTELVSSDPAPTPTHPLPSPDPSQITSELSTPEPPASRNGAHYLLTNLTLFVTHEPCIMCSMALLHSRVKEIFYLIPMEQTGGCGGLACVPKLEGVNHRFGIARWKEGAGGIDTKNIQIATFVDV